MSDQPRAANVYTIPIIDGVEHDWTQMDAFDRRFDHLVANTLHSDMFVRIDTSGQLVPAHRFAIGSANERLKRLVYGPKESSTNTDETSGCDLETIEGKPVLVVKDISPEHCHEVRNFGQPSGRMRELGDTLFPCLYNLFISNPLKCHVQPYRSSSSYYTTAHTLSR